MSVNAQNIILEAPFSFTKRFIDNLVFIQKQYPYIEMNLEKFTSYFLQPREEEIIKEDRLIDISSMFDSGNVFEKIKEYTLEKKRYHCYDTSAISENSMEKIKEFLEHGSINQTEEEKEKDKSLEELCHITLITEFSISINFPNADKISFNARLYEHIGYGYCRQKIISNIFKKELDIEVPEGCGIDFKKNYRFRENNMEKFFSNDGAHLTIFVKIIDRLTNYYLYDKESSESFELCGCDLSPIAGIISLNYTGTECYEDYVNDI